MTPVPSTLRKLPESCHIGESSKGPILLIVLDGYGVGKKDKGDCIHLANPPRINAIVEESQKHNLYCELKAHGTAVGLPSDEDMGNSEVGHNALGCGQLVAQGAKLVNIAIEDGSMFKSDNFNRIVDQTTTEGSGDKTVHFVGLLSDGNVHSHVSQLIKLVQNMAARGVPRVRLHALTDGRDVSSMSALDYVSRVETVFAEINGKEGFDYRFASGGGRMYVTMDRYEADWNIVKRGWDAMVHGELDPHIVKECAEGWTGKYVSFTAAVEGARSMFPKKTDQDYPPWVIVDEKGEPVGKVLDGDIVVCFNFRGDRSIEIARAFEEKGMEFDKTCFDRKNVPETDYYGLLIYDSEKMIPSKSLCPNPVINNVLSEYLVKSNVSQYACSESHKIGHVTYFWNGNRSGYLDASQELYEEVKSEPNEAIPHNPAMRAREIGEKAAAALHNGKYKFLRINLANGDMVGHTGHMDPTVEAVRVLDEVVDKLVELNKKIGGITVITADHGNCEEMLDAKGNPKTSHTLNVVPFIIVDPHAKYVVDTSNIKDGQGAGLTNVAATMVNLLGFEKPSMYRDSLVRFL